MLALADRRTTLKRLERRFEASQALVQSFNGGKNFFAGACANEDAARRAMRSGNRGCSITRFVDEAGWRMRWGHLNFILGRNIWENNWLQT